MLEALVQREVPALLGLVLGRRECRKIHAPGMRAKLRAHQSLHFGFQRPVLKAQNSRSRRRARPRLAVLTIKAETPAHGLAALHQDAGCTTRLAVEGVHAPRTLDTTGLLKELGARQPTLVGHHGEQALRDQVS